MKVLVFNDFQGKNFHFYGFESYDNKGSNLKNKHFKVGLSLSKNGSMKVSYIGKRLDKKAKVNFKI